MTDLGRLGDEYREKQREDSGGLYRRVWHVGITEPGFDDWPGVTYRERCAVSVLRGPDREHKRGPRVEARMPGGAPG